jgi:hypothetical protein
MGNIRRINYMKKILLLFLMRSLLGLSPASDTTLNTLLTMINQVEARTPNYCLGLIMLTCLGVGYSIKDKLMGADSMNEKFPFLIPAAFCAWPICHFLFAQSPVLGGSLYVDNHHTRNVLYGMCAAMGAVGRIMCN